MRFILLIDNKLQSVLDRVKLRVSPCQSYYAQKRNNKEEISLIRPFPCSSSNA